MTGHILYYVLFTYYIMCCLHIILCVGKILDDVDHYQWRNFLSKKIRSSFEASGYKCSSIAHHALYNIRTCTRWRPWAWTRFVNMISKMFIIKPQEWTNLLCIVGNSVTDCPNYVAFCDALQGNSFTALYTCTCNLLVNSLAQSYWGAMSLWD